MAMVKCLNFYNKDRAWESYPFGYDNRKIGF